MPVRDTHFDMSDAVVFSCKNRNTNENVVLCASPASPPTKLGCESLLTAPGSSWLHEAILCYVLLGFCKADQCPFPTENVN